jgi:hypothetical protein
MCCIDPQLHTDGGGSLIIALDTKSALFIGEAIGYVYFWLNIDIKCLLTNDHLLCSNLFFKSYTTLLKTPKGYKSIINILLENKAK